jgi:hypothetical protein
MEDDEPASKRQTTRLIQVAFPQKNRNKTLHIRGRKGKGPEKA